VAAERRAVADVVIHVLAEQATLEGSSDLRVSEWMD
jgi:hypothetical protein